MTAVKKHRPRTKAQRFPVGNQSDQTGIDAALGDVEAGLRDAGVDTPEEYRQRFRAYIEALLLWQPRVSLTAADTAQAIAREHIVDSLPVARLVRPGMRVGDVGSGAGFPGIPVAIVCPAARVVLIESRRKRANFLRDAVRQARMDNVEVREERLETLTGQEAGRYDIIVSRAFGPLDAFLEMVRPLLVAGGMAVAMKGPRGIAEAATGGASGYGEREVLRYRLPNGAEHLLLVYRRR